MTSTAMDRAQAVNASKAIKVPCRAATTAAITLEGEQTVDGVALVTGDRCLVKDQASGVDNGIYVVDTGEWQRSVDADGVNDLVAGTIVKVTAGTVNGGFYGELTTTGTITPGTTSLTFAMRLGTLGSVSAFMQTVLDDATAADARTTLGAYGSGDSPSFADVTMTGGDLIFSSSLTVRANTADAADSLTLTMTGGGAASAGRGGYISIYGNDVASVGGDVYLVSSGASADGATLRLDASAISAVLVGLLDISGSTSGQIKFPSSQNASSNANTLDDYQEATFTPTLRGSSTAGSNTYSVQVGRVVKVGKRAFGEIVVVTTALDGTLAGNLQLAGLPYSAVTASNYQAPARIGRMSSLNLDVAGAYYQFAGSIASAGSTIELYENGDNVASVNLNSSDLPAAACRIEVGFDFETAN